MLRKTHFLLVVAVLIIASFVFGGVATANQQRLRINILPLSCELIYTETGNGGIIDLIPEECFEVIDTPIEVSLPPESLTEPEDSPGPSVFIIRPGEQDQPGRIEIQHQDTPPVTGVEQENRSIVRRGVPLILVGSFVVAIPLLLDWAYFDKVMSRTLRKKLRF